MNDKPNDKLNDKPNTQIIIRHIAGAKVNRIDPFALADTSEITFGREAGSTVMFDSPKDDVVSRRHAVLRVKNDAVPSFTIEDLKSSNGTFVNDERISDTRELLPEDTVAFGKGGPKFTFDVQPRPAGMQARTRVMTAIEASATRVTAVTAATATAANTAQNLTVPPKAGIGRNTVMMLLSGERKKTSQIWMGALAATLAFVVVGGGVLYWRVQQNAAAQAKQLADQAAQNTTQQVNAVTQTIGMAAGDVFNKYGNSTVAIEMRWRLYDKETGRPIYHKKWTAPVDGKNVELPAYFAFKNEIVPWLVTEDEEHRNYEIFGAGSGSGFVVNAQGFILTNKHVGAAWLQGVDIQEYTGTTNGFLLIKNDKGEVTAHLIDIAKLKSDNKLRNWTPEDDGGWLFPTSLPSKKDGRVTRFDLPDYAQKQYTKTFWGKNEELSVRFPGSRMSINAELVRASTDEDVALIKINSPQVLTPLELGTDDSVKVGSRVITLGYPGLSTSTYMLVENSSGKKRLEEIPTPTVTEGIVRKLGVQTSQEGTTKIMSQRGDRLELSTLTGGGNSGGPVFDTDGKVIGIHTAGVTDRGGQRISLAVRIRYGLALLNPQMAQ